MLGGTLGKVTKLGRLFSTIQTDPYYAYVKLLIHGSIADVTARHTLTAGTGTSVAPSAGSLNPSVISFSGVTTQGINITNNMSDFFQNSPWTFEWRGKRTGAGYPAVWWSIYNVETLASSTGKASFGTNGILGTFITPSIAANDVSVLDTTWVNYAITYDGTSMRAFINGKLLNTVTAPINWNGTEFKLGINSSGVPSFPYPLPGDMEEIRFTQICRYTSNYIPQSAPFPNS